MTPRTASRRTRPEPVQRTRRLDFTVGEDVHIPASVVDLTSFNEWAASDEYPESVHVSFLDGSIWVDMEMEQLFTHNVAKLQIGTEMNLLTRKLQLGYFFIDGVRVSNDVANLSTEPDAVFTSFAAVKSGRVVLVRGKEAGFIRLDGSPEMVLEIVSDSSVSKDTERLRELYWKAQIIEFWIVDVRGDEVKFDLLRRGAKGYSATRKQTSGWQRSQVFDRDFRLTRQTDPFGNPDFTLHVKE